MIGGIRHLPGTDFNFGGKLQENAHQAFDLVEPFHVPSVKRVAVVNEIEPTFKTPNDTFYRDFFRTR